MKKIQIYDTSSLLLINNSSLFEGDFHIVISSITLKELERIKTSANKDDDIKYASRQLLRLLNEHQDAYECYVYTPDMNRWLNKYNLEINDDTKILASAYDYFQKNPEAEVSFFTNDISLKEIAKLFFESNVYSIKPEKDTYSGYEEYYLSNEEIAEFYSNTQKYGQNLKINEYVNIFEKESQQRVDTLCWTGENFRPLKYKSFSSKQMGDIKPYKNDIYQAMVADSLMNNKITMIKGPAGAGKSHLAIGYLFSLLEKGKIDKIIIFCNTIATKNSARLGFYPGSRIEKLLDSQIGNFLTSKLGSRIAVEQLIDTEKLILLPMSDIRGYDTSGMNAGIYITEAQNLDIELLKLALQRVGEDAFVILDGDIKSQVDLIDYEGKNNGMRRASKVFRGEKIYGEVELKKIHRSRIAEIANKM